MRWWQIQEKNFYSFSALFLCLILGFPLLAISIGIVGTISPVAELISFGYLIAGFFLYPSYLLFIGVPIAIIGRDKTLSERNRIWLWMPVAVTAAFMLITIIELSSKDRDIAHLMNVGFLVSLTPAIFFSLLSTSYFFLRYIGLKTELIIPDLLENDPRLANATTWRDISFRNGISEYQYYLFIGLLILPMSYFAFTKGMCFSCEIYFYSAYESMYFFGYWAALFMLALLLRLAVQAKLWHLVMKCYFAVLLGIFSVATWQHQAQEIAYFAINRYDCNNFITCSFIYQFVIAALIAAGHLGVFFFMLSIGRARGWIHASEWSDAK